MLGAVARKRELHELSLDSALEQGSPDPRRSPLIEIAPVFRVKPGIARVVEISVLDEPADRRFRRDGIEALMGEMTPRLADGSIASIQVAKRGLGGSVNLVAWFAVLSTLFVDQRQMLTLPVRPPPPRSRSRQPST